MRRRDRVAKTVALELLAAAVMVVAVELDDQTVSRGRVTCPF
jgi:hypothetical protein